MRLLFKSYNLACNDSILSLTASLLEKLFLTAYTTPTLSENNLMHLCYKLFLNNSIALITASNLRNVEPVRDYSLEKIPLPRRVVLEFCPCGYTSSLGGIIWPWAFISIP